ncbi:MAG: ArsR family transcriptional regulator, partial [Nitrospirae bacterium]|nr:ArsR family transcriptional regulator [Nitrospirota bacterium]
MSHKDLLKVIPPKGTKSLIEQAREWSQVLQRGEVKTQHELAQRIGITQPRVTHHLNLLRLAPAIQHYLLKTKDQHGWIRERHLRPLAAIPDHNQQIAEFRRLLSDLS